MKYLLYFAVLFSLCPSCQNGRKTNENSMNKDVTTNENITLEVVPNIFDKDRMGELEIVFILRNKSSNTIQYDSRYNIERHADNHWDSLSFIDNLVFEDIMYGLKPNSSQKFLIAIPKILKDKPIEIGSYRIVKDIWSENQEHEKLTLTAEFTIE